MRERRMPLGQILLLMGVMAGLLLLLVNRPVVPTLAVIAKNGPYDYVGSLLRVDADGSHLQQLADNVRPWFAPTWSPDGKHILFVVESDLWIINADGTNKRQLTQSVEVAYEPAWSPDGKYIVVILNNDVAVIDQEGRVIRQITAQKRYKDTPDTYGYAAVSWSPDGKYIAFEAYHRTQKNNDIMIVDASCATPDSCVNLSPINTPVDEHSYDWSPDSQSIVFGSMRSGTGLMKLYVIHLASGITQQLTDDSLSDRDPQWSPDGKQIAFPATSRDGSELFICLIYPDGLEGWTLPVDDVRQVAWSPDSQFLAYGIGENLYIRADDGSTRTINFPNMDTLTFAWRP